MPTPNYSYEKRQRELAKKRKKEEKLKRKSEPRPEGGASDEAGADDAATPADQNRADPGTPAT